MKCYQLLSVYYTLDPQSLFILLLKVCTLYQPPPIWPTPLIPGNHFSTSYFHGFNCVFFGFTCKWCHTIFALLVWLISLSKMFSNFIHVITNDRRNTFGGRTLKACSHAKMQPPHLIVLWLQASSSTSLCFKLQNCGTYLLRFGEEYMR